MSLDSLRPYFQGAMVAVDSEFREWEDGFNVDNIPNTALDCAWHFSTLPASLVSFNQHCLQMDVPLTINAWVKGYRTPIEAVDMGLKKIESILKECLRHSRRLSQPTIKNVLPTGFNVEAISATNDNIARLVLNFTCRVVIDIET